MRQLKTALARFWIVCVLALGWFLALVSADGTAAAQEETPAGGAASATNDDAAGDADEKEKLQALKLADGRLVLQVPARWEKQQPSVRIIEVELRVPPTAGGTDQGTEGVATAAPLAFRIVANQQDPNHQRVIERAQELSPDEKDVMIDGEKVAMWVPFEVDEFGTVDAPDPVSPGREMVKRLGKDRRNEDIPEALVLVDALNVTSAMLEKAWADTDQAGRPAVSIRFDEEGAVRFGRLTGRNLPDEATGQRKYLGILINGTLISAPAINSRITDQAIIEGNFTKEEVESLVKAFSADRAPQPEKAPEPGRLTVMRAGGSVEANVERWYGQFEQPDGKSSKEAPKVEEKEVDGLKVHTVDLSGTFLDRRGPFAPGTEREGYRMLAAIIQTDGAGNYFIKLTGPAETIKQNEKAFMRMIDELEWTE